MIAVLLSSILRITAILIPSIICCAVSFVGMFVVMFGIIFLKSRKEPMEKHYYSVDYRYNGLTDEQTDNGYEISKEEFYGKKE